MKNSKISGASLNLIRYYQLQRDMKNYQKRIKNVQPTLRQTRQQTNRSCGHIKKQPLAQFNRIVTIDIENHALLKKLTQKSPSFLGKSKPYKLVKNNRKKNIEEYKQRLENAGLLKRIKQAKSSYQTNKFASQRKITQGYINSIAKYGYKNLTPNKTIMFPFYTQNQAKNKKNQINLEKIQQKAHIRTPIQQNYFSQSTNQMNTILNIEKKCWNSTNKQANITYITWQNKVTIQVDFLNENQNTKQNQETMKIQIPNQIFIQYFDQKIRKLHNAVKFDQSEQIFYINLPEKTQRQIGIRKNNRNLIKQV